jgi:hypothetical protein
MLFNTYGLLAFTWVDGNEEKERYYEECYTIGPKTLHTFSCTADPDYVTLPMEDYCR